jgi:hypothetical protein
MIIMHELFKLGIKVSVEEFDAAQSAWDRIKDALTVRNTLAAKAGCLVAANEVLGAFPTIRIGDLAKFGLTERKTISKYRDIAGACLYSLAKQTPEKAAQYIYPALLRSVMATDEGLQIKLIRSPDPPILEGEDVTASYTAQMRLGPLVLGSWPMTARGTYAHMPDLGGKNDKWTTRWEGHWVLGDASPGTPMWHTEIYENLSEIEFPYHSPPIEEPAPPVRLELDNEAIRYLLVACSEPDDPLWVPVAGFAERGEAVRAARREERLRHHLDHTAYAVAADLKEVGALRPILLDFDALNVLVMELEALGRLKPRLRKLLIYAKRRPECPELQVPVTFTLGELEALLPLLKNELNRPQTNVLFVEMLQQLLLRLGALSGVD